MFFISFDDWKMLFFSKSLSLLRDFCKRHIAVFFKTSVLKEGRILRYLHDSSTVPIPKFQNKAIVIAT